MCFPTPLPPCSKPQILMQYFPSATTPALMLMDHTTNPGYWSTAVLMEQDCCFDLHSPILSCLEPNPFPGTRDFCL